MKARTWVGAACFFAQILVPPAAFAQARGGQKPAGASKAEPSPKEKAQAFIKTGDRAAKAGEWEDAYADYSIAWTMYQGWETALGVGRAAAKTGHHAEAVERLSFYLKEAPPKSVTPKLRKEIEQAIEESKVKTGMLTIVAPDGGEVFLDRTPVGKTPLASAIRVDPGKHDIEIRRGDSGESKATEVAAGASVEVKFEPPKAAPPKTVIIKEPVNTWRTPVLITGSTLAVAGLALGGVSLGLSFDRAAAKDEAAKKPEGLDDARRAADDEALFKNMMVWSFIGAGVALAGTAAVFFVTKSPAKPRVEGAIGFGPAGPSLSLRGEF